MVVVVAAVVVVVYQWSFIVGVVVTFVFASGRKWSYKKRPIMCPVDSGRSGRSGRLDLVTFGYDH